MYVPLWGTLELFSQTVPLEIDWHEHKRDRAEEFKAAEAHPNFRGRAPKDGASSLTLSNMNTAITPDRSVQERGEDLQDPQQLPTS
jgi:hypothetical protein